MRTRHFSLQLVVMILFLLSMPLLVVAQTEEPTEESTTSASDVESCDFDLTTVQDLLDKAQMAFDADNQEAAAALLEQVITETEVVRFICDPVPELTKQVSLGAGDLLTFSLPEDWVAIALDDDPFDGSVMVYIGSDSATLSGAMHFPERSLREDLVGDQKLVTISNQVRWRLTGCMRKGQKCPPMILSCH